MSANRIIPGRGPGRPPVLPAWAGWVFWGSLMALAAGALAMSWLWRQR